MPVFWLLYLAMGGSLFVFIAADAWKMAMVIDDIKRDFDFSDETAMPIVMAMMLLVSLLLWPYVFAQWYHHLH